MSDSPVNPGADTPELSLLIDSGTDRPSFHVRLAFEIPSPAGSSIPIPAGWRAVETGDETFGYFSKMNVRTNERFRELTRDLLHWRPDATGVPVPLVLTLDLNVLRNRVWVARRGESSSAASIHAVDLIPLGSGRAMLGVWLSGGRITIFDYLAIVSSRSPDKLELLERKTGTRTAGLPLSRLVNVLAESWLAGCEPDAAVEPVRTATQTMRVCQYLLVGEESRPWADFEAQDHVRAAWERVRTLARITPDYPKYGREDGPGRWTSVHPQALGTRYGFSDHASTTWASAADRFNREAKPKIVLTANYVQWLLARELHAAGGTAPMALSACWLEDVRRFFVEQCWAHAARFESPG